MTNTPVSNFRIPQELKDRVKIATDADGITLTDAVIAGLELYLAEREKT